ncbi:hypothetical protein Ancab_011784 [Ancistrocladus abbreviatus]
MGKWMQSMRWSNIMILLQPASRLEKGLNAFHIAAKQGESEILKVLIEAHPDLSMTHDASNTTALQTTATQGHIEVVNFLLESGSGLTAIVRSNGKTVLHAAARNGHLERQSRTRFLVERETKTTAVNRVGETVIDTVEKTHHPDIRVILQEHGVQTIFSIPGQYIDDIDRIPPRLSLGEVNISPEHAFMIFFVFDFAALFISCSRSNRERSKEEDDGNLQQAHVVGLCANLRGILGIVIYHGG